MLPLRPDVKYDLTSQVNSDDHIKYVSVKLTDSAFKAIEEYLQNQNKINASPQIEILKDKGHISIPSLQDNAHCFNFSLSNIEDMSGPKGSFVFVEQQNTQLRPLGAISHKIKIHANAEEYQAIRNRMAAVQNNEKKNCTQIINYNESSIGRSVQVTQASSRNLPNPKREPEPTRVVSPKPITSIHEQSVIQKLKRHHSNSINSVHNGISEKPTEPSSNSRNLKKPPEKLQIAKRTIQERIIHLLALKSFKKPELYTRLNDEGIKDKEKKCIIYVLKSVSELRDNCYYLRRYAWKDVQCDWPFYSDEEKELIKKRKSQIASTSSINGSTGIGKNSTSTNPGSCSPTINTSASTTTMIENQLSNNDYNEDMRPKKKRISHYVKPTDSYNKPPSESSHNKPIENDYRWPTTNSRDASHVNPRFSEENHAGFISNNYGSTAVISSKRADNRKTFGALTDLPINNIMARNVGFTELSTKRDQEKCNNKKINKREKNEDKKLNKDTFTIQSGVIHSVSHNNQADITEGIVQDDISDLRLYCDISRNQLNNVPDANYIYHYKPIISFAEQERYVRDYILLHKEYMNLFRYITAVTNKYAAVEDRLSTDLYRQSSCTTTMQEIQECSFLIQDPQPHIYKERFDYLHRKLLHIKTQVNNFVKEVQLLSTMDSGMHI